MKAYTFCDPRPGVIVVAQTQQGPIITLTSPSEYRRILRGQRGINRAINAGMQRGVASVRYDRSALEFTRIERDCIGALHLTFNVEALLALLHTRSTDRPATLMKRLFADREHAKAATGDAVALLRAVKWMPVDGLAAAASPC
jgi:hypothetical protein